MHQCCNGSVARESDGLDENVCSTGSQDIPRHNFLSAGRRPNWEVRDPEPAVHVAGRLPSRVSRLQWRRPPKHLLRWPMLLKVSSAPVAIAEPVWLLENSEETLGKCSAEAPLLWVVVLTAPDARSRSSSRYADIPGVRVCTCMADLEICIVSTPALRHRI